MLPVDSGRIRASWQEKFMNNFILVPWTGCWIWMRACTGKGYGQIRVSNVCYLTHRLSWEIHNGEIPEGMFVLHRCDVPPCLNPNHLFLGTAAQNMEDMWRKGRGVGAELGSRRAAKLSIEETLAIHADTRSLSVIAKEYKTCKSNVSRIRNASF